MTAYIILRKDPSETNNLWDEFAKNIKASSAKRALAAANVQAGEFVAIPARSWKPLTVKVESTVKVTIG